MPKAKCQNASCTGHSADDDDDDDVCSTDIRLIDAVHLLCTVLQFLALCIAMGVICTYVPPDRTYKIPTQCIYMLYMHHRKNGDYFPIQH